MINPEQLKHIILGSDYANLKSLNLSNREIDGLPQEISLLTNLRELDLSYNKIVQIPKEVFQLKNLEVLYLHRNEIQFVPREIGHLTKLHTLDLSFNSLNMLDDNIGELKALQYLDLSHNQLTRLPTTLVKLTNIKRLYLEENAFAFPPADIVDRGLYSVMFYLLHHGIKKNEANRMENAELQDTAENLLNKYIQSFIRFLETITGKKTVIDWKLKENQKLNLSSEELKNINQFIQNIPENLLAVHNDKDDILVDLKKVRDKLDLQISKIEASKTISK